MSAVVLWWIFFFFQAEDGIRDLVRSRGLGDVYKRQVYYLIFLPQEILEVKREMAAWMARLQNDGFEVHRFSMAEQIADCLLYTSDAADERSSVDLGGRRILKKQKEKKKKIHV